MDPHPLANIFKISNHDEPISSDLSALDYLYEVLLEIRESENCDEKLYEATHDRSLNKKHDCNDFIINSINVNCANDMQNPKLGDANFAMSTTCCNDHDWGDSFYDIENLFKPHDEYEIHNNVSIIFKVGYLENVQSYEVFDKSGFGEVMTLANVNPTILEECQLRMHVDHVENIYVIAIFLNFLMIPHVIIMREETMVVEIFILLDYLSSC